MTITPNSWVLRVASRPEVGGGHVSRCLTLARGLVEHVPVVFSLDQEGEAWRSAIQSAGYGVVIDDESDTAVVAGVVIDTYDLSPALVDRWRARAKIMTVFSDHEHAPDCADIEIRQWGERKEETQDRIICGLDHVLVDPAYTSIGNVAIRPVPEHVLVCFGYRDANNAGALALESLLRLRDTWTPTITLAIGAGAPHLGSLRERIEKIGGRAKLLLDSHDLVGPLAESDFVIGGGGVFAAERAAAGRPSITLSVAENQRPSAKVLSDAGATIDLGPMKAIHAKRLSQELYAIAKDVQGRTQMAAAGKAVVDGLGAKRLAQKLIADKFVQSSQAPNSMEGT